MVLCFVFFFKQKTAYEMRISDWSSDVCSSDLGVVHEDGDRTERVPHHAQALLDRGPIADVDGHPDRRAAVGGDLGRRGVSRVAVEVEDRDLGAVVGPARRAAEAAARCAPRHDGPLLPPNPRHGLPPPRPRENVTPPNRKPTDPPPPTNP